MPNKSLVKRQNPRKIFVLEALSREAISEMLNAALEDASGPDGCGWTKGLDQDALAACYFTPDDPRLTDDVCEEIVEVLHDAAPDSYESDSIAIRDFVLDVMPKRMRKRSREI